MTDPRTPSRGGWKWPLIIVGLLTLNVGVCTVTIVAAVTSNADAEPDYYQRSLTFDADSATWPTAASLGWRISATSGDAAAHVAAFDGHGTPIRILATHAEWFHRARSAQRAAETIAATDEGHLSIPLNPAAPGVWELRLRLETSRGPCSWTGAVELPPPHR